MFMSMHIRKQANKIAHGLAKANKIAHGLARLLSSINCRNFLKSPPVHFSETCLIVLLSSNQ